MEEPSLKSIHFDENGLEITMQGHAVVAIATLLGDWFEDIGARNFASVEVSHPRLGPLEMTMQRKWKQTPSQLASKYREVLERIAWGDKHPEILANNALMDPEYDY